MPFPNLKPSARSWDAGDFPVKIFKSQSGVETRVLYGSRRSGAQLSLTYENITDNDAGSFLTHYEEAKGTFSTFPITFSGQPENVQAGWGRQSFNVGAGTAWRYAEPPQITSIYPGRSTVTVKLVATL